MILWIRASLTTPFLGSNSSSGLGGHDRNGAASISGFLRCAHFQIQGALPTALWHQELGASLGKHVARHNDEGKEFRVLSSSEIYQYKKDALNAIVPEEYQLSHMSRMHMVSPSLVVAICSVLLAVSIKFDTGLYRYMMRDACRSGSASDRYILNIPPPAFRPPLSFLKGAASSATCCRACPGTQDSSRRSSRW